MSELDPTQFLGRQSHGLADADAVVLPLPFEKTVSYGKGTAGGPRAIINASLQVEFFDEELRVDFEQRPRLHTVAPVKMGRLCARGYLGAVSRRVAGLRGKFLLALGGEHLVTWGVVKGLAEDPRRLTVVQVDAHADLRDQLEGVRWSHATVMRRLRELGCRTVQIGIRALSREEYELAEADERIRIFYAYELAERWKEVIRTLRSLKGDVFLTFDVDGLDISVMPSTGTPMPGGLNWRQAMEVMRAVTTARGCRLIGADVVEFVPSPRPPGCDIVAAQIAEKILAHWAAGRRR